MEKGFMSVTFVWVGNRCTRGGTGKLGRRLLQSWMRKERDSDEGEAISEFSR